MNKITLMFAALVVCMAANAQSTAYVPTDENLKARQEFQDNKLGVFIHWGVYSMLADGEWVMLNKHIERDEYAQLLAGFYPSRFDADEWVRTIKDAGARYICITSRHHDGFSMFKSAVSDYNIVDATPFKRDVLKELADACQRHGIKLHFYYSHLIGTAWTIRWAPVLPVHECPVDGTVDQLWPNRCHLVRRQVGARFRPCPL